jgi:hypothetical protein
MGDQYQPERTVEDFDYELGQLHGLPGVTTTKQATVRATNGLTESATWIIQTFRKRDVAEDAERALPAKDTIFVEFIGSKGRSLRLVIPPPVAEVIARQREALVSKNRTSGARQAAATRKERGIEPGFLKTKRRKKGGAK